MSAIKRNSGIGLKSDFHKSPVLAREKSNSVPAAIIGDGITMSQQAIQRWENEGGEIPNVNRILTAFVLGACES